MNRITRTILSYIAVAMLTPLAVGVEKLSAERMWSMVRLGDADISPDGKLAVISATRFDIEENRGYTDLWLYPTDGTADRRRCRRLAELQF
jgi:dipeptidyl aminopeptidase/acylaminoacyl peptidase